MCSPFHPDPAYPAPFPYSRSAESIDDEFSSKAVFAALKGEAESGKTSYMFRGWAILTALLNPAKRKALETQFCICLPTLSSKKDYTRGCEIALTWKWLERMFPDIPRPLPTDPYHPFFQSDAASFGLWEPYVTLYHKFVAGEYQRQNGDAIRAKLLLEKKPGVYVVELTHKDKEFPKGSLGTYTYEQGKDEPKPYQTPALHIAGHIIARKVKCRMLNYVPLVIDEHLLGDRSPTAYATLVRQICLQPTEAQPALWKFLAKNQPTVSTAAEFIPYLRPLLPELDFDTGKCTQTFSTLAAKLDGGLVHVPVVHLKEKRSFSGGTVNALLPLRTIYGNVSERIAVALDEHGYYASLSQYTS